MRRKKCRLWWPSNVSSQTRNPNAAFILFGWFIFSSEASFDVVVAFICDELSLCSSATCQSDLQEILQQVNKDMHVLNRDKCKLSLLGCYEVDESGNGMLLKFANGKNINTNCSGGKQHSNACSDNRARWSCGCSKVNRLSEQGRIAAVESMWIKLVYGNSKTTGRRDHVIPKFDHLHWNGETVFQLDLQVIIYETPTFGGQHYAVGVEEFSNVGRSCKIPKWFDNLNKKDRHLDLNTVIRAINSADAAKLLLLGDCHTASGLWFHIVYRYPTCVDFAEKAAIQKHSMWSNVVVDVLLGNIIGLALWFMAEPVCLLISNFSFDITNYWMRTGCVWLMGNPAGFKLNTELAGVLGMISLTAIQIWSTLWTYAGFLSIYFIKGLSLCGIIFGLTTAATLLIDIISFVALHILTLHLFLSLLYSTQIQAVAALWRLFRGMKWNPLRHRLDSYDYTVEQHVVGSLLFTPIILLLPTTSAFYIFFTILHASVCIICVVIEIAIFLIHATPYAKVLLWLKSKNRFPSGIWFEVASCGHSETVVIDGNNSSSEKLEKIGHASSNKPDVLVSFLHSNYLNLGEVVSPHYRYIVSAFSWSSIASSAHRLLSGKSIPCSLGVDYPPKLPWIVIPWKEYWCLCYNSVYSCRGNPYNNLRK